MPSSDLDARLMSAIDRLARTRRATVQRLATANRLSPLQVELLTMVCGGPPPEPQAAKLARDLGVSAATVADALGALARKGLVTDCVDPTDRRRKTIAVTSTGRSLGAKLGRELQRLADPMARVDEANAGVALEVLLTIIAGHFESGVVSVDRSCLTCCHHRPGGVGEPDFCELLRTSLTPSSLQVNCAEHELVDA